MQFRHPARAQRPIFFTGEILEHGLGARIAGDNTYYHLLGSIFPTDPMTSLRLSPFFFFPLFFICLSRVVFFHVFFCFILLLRYLRNVRCEIIFVVVRCSGCMQQSSKNSVRIPCNAPLVCYLPLIMGKKNKQLHIPKL